MVKHPAHRARPGRTGASLLMLAALAVATAGCETTGGLAVGSGETRAERLADSGAHAEAASVLIGAAAQASGPEQDRLTLLAVEQWLEAGDVTRARNAFAAVRKPSAGELHALWSANAAALELYVGDPDEALAILEPLSRAPLSAENRLRIDALRADAWLQKGDPLRAIELYRQRESWLDDRRAVESNRNRLWQGLLLSNPADLRAAADLTRDPVARGWLTLGSLAATTGRQGIGWSNGILRWREQHASHPAMTILEDFELPDAKLLAYPRRIALLLPLSGPAASAGRAIRNGFLGAYFAAAGGLDDRQSIRIYDVDLEGGASAAYTNAVSDGAEFVVGPLLKESVAELANDILVPVPVLTLNYLPDDTLAPPGLYQFALAPEDEAAAAAERALADGHTRAVALVPNNPWGRRVLSSFAGAFEAQGGTLLDYRSYSPANQDFSNTIEDLMALSGSVQRYQRLRANIGGPLQFDPRRRQDAEFIFLAADAPAGRLLKSQLKFHYSGDLPVYATSSIHAMDGRSNADLNGILFADTPWLISPQSWIAYLPETFREYWPEERRLGRLHAMGYDAYQLVAPLFGGGEGIPEIEGATGRLYLDDAGRVHRRLAWAKFERGEPVPLAEPRAPETAPDRDRRENAADEPWYEQTREL